MHTWAPVDLPRLEGSGPPLRLYDTSTGEVRPTAPGPDRHACTSAASPPTTPPTSAMPPPTWRSTWSTGTGATSATTCTTCRTSPTSTTRCSSAPPATSDDWVVLGLRETALFREDMAALRVVPPRHYIGAVEAMGEIAELVGKLLAAGAAYRVDDPEFPDVYFDSAAHRALRLREPATTSRRCSGCRASAAATRTGRASATRSDALLWRTAREGEPSWDVDLGPGRPGLARRVRGDRAEPARPADRRQRRRLGPDLPAPRVRRRARRGAHRRPPVRPALRARRDDRARRREDVARAAATWCSSPSCAPRASTRTRSGWPCSPGTTAATGRGRRTCSTPRRSGWPRWRAGRRPRRRPGRGRRSSPACAHRLADDLDTAGALAAVDAWAAGEGTDAAAPGLVRDAVDALLGVAL